MPESLLASGLFGRRNIYTSETVFDKNTIPQIINAAMVNHKANSAQAEYLINYYRGIQPVLTREKEVRSDIQHNIVLNYANCIVRDKTGYFLSAPMQYTLRNSDKQNSFDEYKTLLVTEDKSSVDFETATNASICGHGYTMVVFDSEKDSGDDESPIEFISLDPRTTCVIRESKVTHDVVVCFTYYTEEKLNGGTYTVYDVRTASERYVYRSAGLAGTINPLDLLPGYPKRLGLPIPPIVEYKNNTFMLGDFEIVLGLLDAINVLSSNSLEDIEQFVQSLLVFINAEVTQESFSQLMLQKFAVLEGKEGQTVDAKYIASQLNPESVKQLRDYFKEVLLFITSTPDRGQTTTSGNPTGTATFLGNGFPAQENDARVKSMTWYKAERDVIRLSLALLHKRGIVTDLESRDLTPIINRTLRETAQSSAQVQQMLLAGKLYSPADIMAISPMTTDTAQAISNGMKYWGDQWAGGAENATQEGII